MKLVCSFHFDKCLNSGFDWLEGVVWFLLLLSICPSWTPLAKSRARRSKRHKPSTVQPTEKVIHQQEKARYGVYQGDPRGYDVSVNSRGARHSLSRSSPSLCCVAWLRLPVGHERPTAGLYSWLFGSRSSQRCGWVHGSQHPRGVRHPTSLLGDRMHLSIVEQCQGATYAIGDNHAVNTVSVRAWSGVSLHLHICVCLMHRPKYYLSLTLSARFFSSSATIHCTDWIVLDTHNSQFTQQQQQQTCQHLKANRPPHLPPPPRKI